VEKTDLIATKGEAGVGKLLVQALSELGDDGALSFQLGNGREDQLDLVEDIHYEQGFLSPYFITDKTRGEAVLECPYILLYDRVISDFLDFVPILEAVAAECRPLLLIAEGVDEKALTGLLLNHVRGIFKVVAIKPPGFGENRINRLQDSALLTGGTPVLESYAVRLEDVTLSQLGQAQRAAIIESSTTAARPGKQSGSERRPSSPFATRNRQLPNAESACICPSLLDLFLQHPWPGNIRQLINVVRATIYTAGNNLIGLDDLPLDFVAEADRESFLPEPTLAANVKTMTLEDWEVHGIKTSLQACAGNISQAAKQLGITRTTLYKKIDRFGLKRFSCCNETRTG
jgi:DNA-binding phage protein